MNSMISLEPLPRTTFSRPRPSFSAIAPRNCPSASVGIKVRALERLVHRCEGLWRWTERIFVGSQLDDLRGLQAHFACQLLDGLAGLVGDKFQNVLVRGFPHRRFWFSICRVLRRPRVDCGKVAGTLLQYVTLGCRGCKLKSHHAHRRNRRYPREVPGLRRRRIEEGRRDLASWGLLRPNDA